MEKIYLGNLPIHSLEFFPKSTDITFENLNNLYNIDLINYKISKILIIGCSLITDITNIPFVTDHINIQKCNNLTIESKLHGYFLYIASHYGQDSDITLHDVKYNLVAKIPEIDKLSELDYTIISNFIKTNYRHVSIENFDNLYKILPQEEQHQLRKYKLINKYKNVI